MHGTMNTRCVAATALAIIAAILSWAPTASGRAGPFPRTSDGRPDLQGFWTNETFTPLERPPELAGKESFTEEEAAAYHKRRRDQFLNQSRTDVHYDDAIWQAENYDSQPNLQTSLVVDPRDGRIPSLTPEGERRVRARADASRSGSVAGIAGRTLAERCISWGNVGPPMIPPSYNANLQILQTRDHVVIRHEMIHDSRIIPVVSRSGSNGALSAERPHLGANIRMLAGDSRGRWEGDTLVVDTTNFTHRTNFRGAPRHTRQDILASDALHVTERFTRVAADRIRYQFTVEDPVIWTRPWSGEVPLRKFGGPIYEYACHEGNYGLTNILRGLLASENSPAQRP